MSQQHNNDNYNWKQVFDKEVSEKDMIIDELNKEIEKQRQEIEKLQENPLKTSVKIQTDIKYLSELEYSEHIAEIDRYIEEIKDCEQKNRTQQDKIDHLIDEIKNRDDQLLVLSEENDYLLMQKQTPQLPPKLEEMIEQKYMVTNENNKSYNKKQLEQQDDKEECFNEKSLFPISNGITIIKESAKRVMEDPKEEQKNIKRPKNWSKMKQNLLNNGIFIKYY